MSDLKKASKISKIFCIIGSSFLLIMGAFHGSGFFYVSGAIEKSNAEDFLKDIVPVLFVHPSIHLIHLAGFGVLGLFFTQDFRMLTRFIAAVVSIDAGLAFYLGGLIPGCLLSLATICFVISGYQSAD